VAENVEPAFHALIRQAAQGEVIHNDDTSARILSLMKEAPREGQSENLSADGRDRTGTFTTGIVATGEDRKIALFFTGRDHAGENLAKVLAERASELGPPIQMCDALSRNLPASFEVVLANCTAHGRRKFVDVAGSFPAECRYVLEVLADVYRTDGRARDQGLSPDDRLALHQAESGPRMAELAQWLDAQINERKTEPNSGLGKAITYMKKHWPALTLFLRAPGAPLDNNLCERVLKKAILHRKNALFFKTLKGAQVADLFMSLIHTCELNGVNAFDYLIELQRNAGALRLNPGDWLPWNYRQTLDRRQAAPSEPTPVSDA
jgi:hypothetical protein